MRGASSGLVGLFGCWIASVGDGADDAPVISALRILRVLLLAGCTARCLEQAMMEILYPLSVAVIPGSESPSSARALLVAYRGGGVTVGHATAPVPRPTGCNRRSHADAALTAAIFYARLVFVGVGGAWSRLARVLCADVVCYAGSGFTTPVRCLLKGSGPFSEGQTCVADAEGAYPTTYPWPRSQLVLRPVPPPCLGARAASLHAPAKKRFVIGPTGSSHSGAWLSLANRSQNP